MKLVIIGASPRDEALAASMGAALSARGHHLVGQEEAADAHLVVAIGPPDAANVMGLLSTARRRRRPSALVSRSVSPAPVSADWVIAPTPEVLVALAAATALPSYRLLCLPSAFESAEVASTDALDRVFAKMATIGPYRPIVSTRAVAVMRPLLARVAHFAPRARSESWPRPKRKHKRADLRRALLSPPIGRIKGWHRRKRADLRRALLTPPKGRTEAWHRRKRRRAHLKRALLSPIRAARQNSENLGVAVKQVRGATRRWRLKILPRLIEAIRRAAERSIRRAIRSTARGRKVVRRKLLAFWRLTLRVALWRPASPRR